MKRWLARIGWEMQTRRKPPSWRSRWDEELLVSREEIAAWLVKAISAERGPADAAGVAAHFLDFVTRRSGLLVPRGPDKFAFAHLTFQEYFAAFQMRGRVRQFDRLAQECTTLSAEPQWHETLNLLFEMLAEFPGARRRPVRCHPRGNAGGRRAPGDGQALYLPIAGPRERPRGIEPRISVGLRAGIGRRHICRRCD
jgi:hypothetical protein